MLKKLDDLRFSEIKEVFINCLTVLFSQGVEDESSAQFAKALMDHIVRAVDACTVKGLDQAMLPIFNVSIWQGMAEADKGLFSFRPEWASGHVERDNNLMLLVNKIQDAIAEWGDESFGGAVIMNDQDEEEATWIIPKKKEEK